MKRRSILLALGAIVASSMSSGCYCYRPLLYRFGGCSSPYGPALGNGPLLGAPMAASAPVSGGFGGGFGVDPGCVGCGGGIGHNGAASYPIAQGVPMQGGYAGMPANPGYAGMPTTGVVAANPPFTGYPVLVGAGQPGLGAPIASKELPPPSVMPVGSK